MGGKTIFCTGDKLGRGEKELGETLIRNFFYSIAEGDNFPDTVIFMNRGVYLVQETSDTASSLKKLAEGGVKILSCGTCLDYYVLKENPLIGEVSNMHSITDILAESEQVVTI